MKWHKFGYDYYRVAGQYDIVTSWNYDFIAAKNGGYKNVLLKHQFGKRSVGYHRVIADLEFGRLSFTGNKIVKSLNVASQCIFCRSDVTYYHIGRNCFGIYDGIKIKMAYKLG